MVGVQAVAGWPPPLGAIDPGCSLFFQAFTQWFADIGRHLDQAGGPFGDAFAVTVGDAFISLAPRQLQAHPLLNIEGINIQLQACVSLAQFQTLLATAAMQLQRLTGVKAEVVDVGTGEGAGAFIHTRPDSTRNSFAVIDQLFGVQL